MTTTHHASFSTKNLTHTQILIQRVQTIARLKAEAFAAVIAADAMATRIETHIDITAETCEVRVGGRDGRREGGGMSEKALWHGSACYIPADVAVCPECKGELTAMSLAWETDTGRPFASSIEIDCVLDIQSKSPDHRWSQGDWQPIRDAVAKWCGARQKGLDQ